MEKRVLDRVIEHVGSGCETRLPEGLLIDGYSEPREDENHKGLVFQFHGCFWHGCPRCYRINRDVKLMCGNETMDDRYEKTCAVSDRIKSSGYMLIEKWECDFDADVRGNEDIQRFVRENNEIFTPLNPRDAFF